MFIGSLIGLAPSWEIDGRSQPVEPLKIGQGMNPVGPAHLGRRLQAAADCRAFRLPEDTTAIVLIELYATHAGRFSVRHTGDCRCDRRRNAAGATAAAA
jgi:hypothetical protein